MPRILAGIAVVALALTGCYGSTEKATDVGRDSAVLHARGTTNNGPAESYFEYWPTASPGSRATTPVQSWPGGVSGPFSQSVGGLQQGTRYTFRMCGNDQGQPSICAQERTFETQSPDLVSGTATDGDATARVDASSGPSGEDPEGSMSVIGTSGGVAAGFSGEVNCLEVEGDTVRLATTTKPFIGGTVGPFTTFYAKIEAGAGPGQDTFDFESGELSPTPDCGAYDGGGRVLTGDFEVTDAQPPQPPS